MAANESKGVGKWVLGFGPSGTYGHVELLLRRLDRPGAADVAWSTRVDADIEERLSRFVGEYLTGYTRGKEFALHAEILHVGIDSERQNHHERAANLALRQALEGLSLDPPTVYAPPDACEDEADPLLLVRTIANADTVRVTPAGGLDPRRRSWGARFVVAAHASSISAIRNALVIDPDSLRDEIALTTPGDLDLHFFEGHDLLATVTYISRDLVRWRGLSFDVRLLEPERLADWLRERGWSGRGATFGQPSR